MRHIDNQARLQLQALVIEAQSHEMRGELTRSIDTLDVISAKVRGLRQRLRAVRRREAKRGRLL